MLTTTTMDDNKFYCLIKHNRCRQRYFISLLYYYIVLNQFIGITYGSSIFNRNHDISEMSDLTKIQNFSIKTEENTISNNYESFNKDIFDQLTTNNPCLVHYCPKGRECILDDESNEPKCVCQRYCSHRKRPICGTDGKIYENHCQLHRASCLESQPITYQRFENCNNFHNLNRYMSLDKRRTSTISPEIAFSSILSSTSTSTSTSSSSSSLSSSSSSLSSLSSNGDNSMTKSDILSIDVSINEIEDNENETPSNIELQMANHTQMEQNEQNEQKITSTLVDKMNLTKPTSIPTVIQSKDYCSSQEYEIMKDNLLLYSHARLMSKDNNHSKDFLVSIMFSHYDQNNNAHLEVDEMNQISIDEHLEELSNGCILADMLNFDDTNHDGKLSINEFYQAFSKLYSVSVVSLDKALETNHLSARVGDNVEIKCDVTGSPSPPLIWRRNEIDLALVNEEEIRVFNDGSLYLTRIQLYHGGNYSCHAQRNKDVVQTHVLQVYTVPEVRVLPRIQSKRPGESSEMFCHITGDPFPKVEWLKNDERINIDVPDKYEIIGNGTSLKIRNIVYSDTGAYMCQANNIGGSVRDISSLIVQEEPTPTVLVEDRKFFVFHEFGIAVYQPTSCRLHHQIQGTDIIPGTQEYVCGRKDVQCIWGRAINVGTHYIFTSQPNRDRVLVISTIQMVVVDVIPTDKYPVELHYVARLDQVWVLNWREMNLTDMKTIQVIRDAGQKRKHHTVHPQLIDGHFDLVKDLFIPSSELEQPHYSYKYGYVTHKNQRGLYKLDLANLRYTKSVDLSMYNCVPDTVEFSALYGFVLLFCREPITNNPQGQLVLDYLTDAVLTTKLNLNGIPKISPDSRHLAVIEHRTNYVVIVIQKITSLGLEFLFDVKTTLNISDVAFYESQSMHGYDLFASASDKDYILYINLFTGKVEMITGVGASMPMSLVHWNNPVRIIRASGLFGQYMVTPANNALFVINGKARTVNCEIGGILHPVAVIWVHNMSPSYIASTSNSYINTYTNNSEDIRSM